MSVGAKIGRFGNIGGQHAAADGGKIGFNILIIGANIADVREGEGDDLARIRRVRHRFLIAGHSGIETDFAEGDPLDACASAPKHRTIGQHQSGVAARRARGIKVVAGGP